MAFYLIVDSTGEVFRGSKDPFDQVPTGASQVEVTPPIILTPWYYDGLNIVKPSKLQLSAFAGGRRGLRVLRSREDAVSVLAKSDSEAGQRDRAMLGVVRDEVNRLSDAVGIPRRTTTQLKRFRRDRIVSGQAD